VGASVVGVSVVVGASVAVAVVIVPVVYPHHLQINGPRSSSLLGVSV